MAKKTTHIKGANVVATNGKGASFEHHESFDDNLLPDSTELSKLKELDPTIIEWVKERTAKEQDSRISFNDRKMSLLEKNNSRFFILDILSMLSAFAIIIAGMWFSYFLLIHKEVVTSTIFAGGTILFAANAFLNFRNKKSTETPKK
ncbi:MAG: hypothetical protein QM541_14410 [Flavobacterium sp.]|nr:hypothetical protein [Flavobacterium sp.]